MKIGLIVNTTKDANCAVAGKLLEKLSKTETVSVTPEAHATLSSYPVAEGERLYKEQDMLLVLGGDGTLLRAARHAAPYGTPVLGINLGSVGFLSGVEPETFLEGDAPALLRSVKIENRMMLEAFVTRGGEKFESFYALNDAVIRGKATESLLRMDVSADGKPLASYVADGIVFATPTGSTAYSFAAGGALVHPAMDALLVTSISPYMLHARPVVLPGESVVCASFSPSFHAAAYLNVDGEDKMPLETGDVVTMQKAPYRAQIATLREKSFLEILKEKLKG